MNSRVCNIIFLYICLYFAYIHVALVLQGLIEDVESQLTACDQEIHNIMMKRYKVMYIADYIWATRSMVIRQLSAADFQLSTWFPQDVRSTYVCVYIYCMYFIAGFSQCAWAFLILLYCPNRWALNSFT